MAPYYARIKPKSNVKLSDFDPGADSDLDKDEGEQATAKLDAELRELYDLFTEAATHSLLIVLQGRDAAGKDGTVRHLMGSINAMNCRVTPFKVPTPEEASHDFLWRIHAAAPSHGQSAIYNRSHYEDVLVVRVHNLVPDKVWKSRFDRINEFESLLISADTILLKFYLHVSAEEQEQNGRPHHDGKR